MTNSRAKGIRGENEAAKLWRRWFPDAKRSFGQAREGFEQPDILNTGQFFVEVKRYANEPTNGEFCKWWDKAIADWGKYEKLNSKRKCSDPVLMWRSDGGEWQIAMYGDLAYSLPPLTHPNLEIGSHIIFATDWKSFARCMDEAHTIVNP